MHRSVRIHLALFVALASCHRNEAPPAPADAAASAVPVVALPTAAASASGAPLPDELPPMASAAPEAAASADAGPGKTSKPADAGAATAAPKASASPDAGAAATATAALPPPTPGSADSVAADVDAIYVPKKTFTARFTQKHKQYATGIEKTSTGTVSVDKPKIAFRYDPPNNSVVVSDGQQVKIFEPDNQQMIVRPIDKSDYPGAVSFLMGTGLRGSFTFTFNKETQFTGGPVLLGKPIVPSPFYDTVVFYIDKDFLAKKDPNTIRRVLLVDAQRNRNQFDFEKASQPDSINPSLFVLVPPAGTKILQSP